MYVNICEKGYDFVKSNILRVVLLSFESFFFSRILCLKEPLNMLLYLYRVKLLHYYLFRGKNRNNKILV